MPVQGLGNGKTTRVKALARARLGHGYKGAARL
jgi:hypothetical protein